MSTPQPTSNSRLMSQSAYARKRGVSRQAIHELVKRKVIPLVDGKIDPQIADLKVCDLDPARSKLAGMGMGGTAAPAAAAPAAAPAPPRDPHADQYRGSKATREKYESLRAQLEYEKELGSVVNREGVGKALTSAGRSLRDEVLSQPGRLAPQCVGLDARAIEQLLDKALRGALDSFVAAAAEGLQRALEPG